jgi:hypothetical protein
MPLFQLGDFTLRSGIDSRWRIECDALTPDDWAALARIASEILEPFGVVEGVPRGGIPFADALRKYATPDCPTLLIAEDVVTSGGSMERHKGARAAIGVTVFARGPCPRWVTPVFTLTPAEPYHLLVFVSADGTRHELSVRDFVPPIDNTAGRIGTLTGRDADVSAFYRTFGVVTTANELTVRRGPESINIHNVILTQIGLSTNDGGNITLTHDIRFIAGRRPTTSPIKDT